MMKIKRYESQVLILKEKENGDLVKYADVEPVLKENEALKAMVNYTKGESVESSRCIVFASNLLLRLAKECEFNKDQLSILTSINGALAIATSHNENIETKTPEQSLSYHDKAVREECAKKADKHINTSAYAQGIANEIRALNKD